MKREQHQHNISSSFLQKNNVLGDSGSEAGGGSNGGSAGGGGDNGGGGGANNGGGGGGNNGGGAGGNNGGGNGQPDSNGGNNGGAGGGGGGNGGSFGERGLKAHNMFRKIHNAPAMTLDESMSKEAEEYAKKLASMGTLQHAQTEYGENLAMKCSSRKEDKMTAEEATKNWQVVSAHTIEVSLAIYLSMAIYPSMPIYLFHLIINFHFSY